MNQVGVASVIARNGTATSDPEGDGVETEGVGSGDDVSVGRGVEDPPGTGSPAVLVGLGLGVALGEPGAGELGVGLGLLVGSGVFASLSSVLTAAASWATILAGSGT